MNWEYDVSCRYSLKDKETISSLMYLVEMYVYGFYNQNSNWFGKILKLLHLNHSTLSWKVTFTMRRPVKLFIQIILFQPVI